MESERKQTPLIVIVGPTASGKSGLAMHLAKFIEAEAAAYKYEAAAAKRESVRRGAENRVQSYARGAKLKTQSENLPNIRLDKITGAALICADSRTVYRGMDIGTAKPTKEERSLIKHYLLDVVDPGETFTAATFKAQVLLAINLIAQNHCLPIMVGGTGLYIDGVIFDYAFLPPAGEENREYLNSLSINQLQEKLKEQGIAMPENAQNKRHLIRKLETNGMVAVKKGIRENTLVLGLDIDKESLEERIAIRLAEMLARGLEQEVRALARKYGWDAPGLSAVGYKEWRGYFNEEQSLAETIKLLHNHTLQYAKRQRTWFKRNQHILWVKDTSEAEAIVKKFLRETA